MGASLCGAKLQRADLAGANLEGALLARANLERANLTSARLKYAVLAEAHLKETLVYSADLKGVALDPEQLAGTVLVDVLVAAHKEAPERTEPAKANGGDDEWMQWRWGADDTPARKEPSEPPNTGPD